MNKCENPVCNNIIKNRKKRYCSRKCNNHHYGLLHYDKYNPKKTILEQKCGNPKCNNLIKTSGKFKNSRKYCSRKCLYLGEYYNQKNNPERCFKRRIRVDSLKISEIFIKSKSNKCELCGSKQDLHIHHNKYTLNFDDWQLLCNPCHRKIHP